MSFRVKVISFIFVFMSFLYSGDNLHYSNNSNNKDKLSNSLFTQDDENIESNEKNYSEINNTKHKNIIANNENIEDFMKDIENYKKRVIKEWIILIIMAIAGIGGLILVFINIIKIKKMQDEIEDKQKILMKDIEESEKYV